MSEETRIIQCSNIGLAGSTDVIIRKTDQGYEARMGVALFGATDNTEEQMEKCDFNPFHPDFHDNYVSGKGATEEEAIANMNKDAKDMAASLWY